MPLGPAPLYSGAWNPMGQNARAMPGTMGNPLQVQPSQASISSMMQQRSEGDRYSELAEALAQQQMRAGPNGWLNIAGAFLAPLAVKFNRERAAKAYGRAAEEQYGFERAERDEDREWKRRADEDAKQSRRRMMENAPDLPQWAKDVFVESAQFPKLPAAQRPQVVDGNLVDPATGRVIFHASRASTPRQLSEFEQRAAYLQKHGTPEQLATFMLGDSAPKPAAGPKAPSGYRWTDDERSQLEPIPGGNADPATVARKQEVTAATKQQPVITEAIAAMQRMRDLVAEHGTEQMPGATKAQMASAYGTARDAVRVLANTGVLNMGELPFLEERLNDPTAWTAMRSGPILAQLDENIGAMQKKADRLQGTRGGSAPARGASGGWEDGTGSGAAQSPPGWGIRRVK